jgi:hypothetical protein
MKTNTRALERKVGPTARSFRMQERAQYMFHQLLFVAHDCVTHLVALGRLCQLLKAPSCCVNV